MKPQRTFLIIAVIALISLAILPISTRAQDPENSIPVESPATGTDPITSQLPDLDATVPKDVPEFIPTNEWQPILSGQSIPPGLWVRMNVYEGTREARLLPPTEKPAPTTHRPRKHHTTEAPTDTVATSTEEKKATLLLPQPSGDTIVQPPPRPSRSIEELKADLAELSHFFQPAGESVMQRVHALLNITSTTSTNDIILILQDLEEMTHQIDHALDMYTAGGLVPLLDMISHDGMILRDRNMDDILNIRYYAVWLLGVTASNNPITSKQARTAGTIPSLIHLFIHPTTPHPHDITYHDSIRKLQSKIIFTLSSLLRNSAEGQDVFVMSSSSEIWQQFHTHLFPSSPINKHDITLRDKILTLLSDMLSDRLINGVHMNMENVSSIRLFDIITNDIWCHTYGILLSEIEKETDKKWISTVVEMTSMLLEGKVCATEVTHGRVNHARQVGQRLAIISAEEEINKQEIDLVINGADADAPTAANADAYQAEMADLTRELISAIALVDEPQQPVQQQEL